jgi:lipopolysaccharide export LptBFGC system permease protein LptF
MAYLGFNTPREDTHMLYTVAVILLVLWLLGLVTSYTLGGFIHIFLVIALVVLVFGVISGRRGAA